MITIMAASLALLSSYQLPACSNASIRRSEAAFMWCGSFPIGASGSLIVSAARDLRRRGRQPDRARGQNLQVSERAWPKRRWRSYPKVRSPCECGRACARPEPYVRANRSYQRIGASSPVDWLPTPSWRRRQEARCLSRSPQNSLLPSLGWHTGRFSFIASLGKKPSIGLDGLG
jgi:hypothetical protein